jgi:hypothetical protein
LKWVHKALRDSNQDEIVYHKSSLDELNKRYDRILQRLDQLYDDKLDGTITEDFYQRKAKQHSDEKEEIASAIQRHSNANIKYYELGINLYELSQRSKEIYLKASKEERRQLLNLALNKLQLNNGKLIYTFSKPFELLSEAIKETNSSKVSNSIDSPAKNFELTEIRSNDAKNRDILPVCPVWRRRWDDFRTFEWVDSVNSPELVLIQTQKLLKSRSIDNRQSN